MNNTISTLGCTYQPRYSDYKFHGMNDYDVWLHYKNASNELERDEALDALCVCHDLMLVKLAYKMATYHPEVGTFEDFLQSARLGALLAYDNYDADKAALSSTKLSTYVYSSVYHTLLTVRDADWFIPCPAQKRAARTYLKGGYDDNPDKKKKFEEKYKINSEEDVTVLRERYKLLVNGEMVSLDSDFTDTKGQINPGAYEEIIEDDTILKEDNIILYMRINEAKEKLSFNKQKVFDMYFVEEFNANEIAEEMNVPVKRIRDDIFSIRKHFKKTMGDVVGIV